MSPSLRYIVSRQLRAPASFRAPIHNHARPQTLSILEMASVIAPGTSRSSSTTTATPPKHKFIVWAPDSTDPGALARRLAVRPAHLVNARELQARGVLRASRLRSLSRPA
jgi:hypothetical protein